MKTLLTRARAFLREEDGAAMAEYAILLAFIAIVSIAIIITLGGKISARFKSISDAFS